MVSQPCPTSVSHWCPSARRLFSSRVPVSQSSTRNAREKDVSKGSNSNRVQTLEIAMSTGTLGHQMTFGGNKNVSH